ncbi:MAG TPA: hypothetical protein PLR99_00200 [Polyangiaceae bacterium]|nr:hypothetical protein [Polyangiaceae bacterium]
MSAPREPTRAEIDAARRAAAKLLSEEFSRLAPDHDQIVSEALVLARRRWDGERKFSGLVKRDTKRLAMSWARTADRRGELAQARNLGDGNRWIGKPRADEPSTESETLADLWRGPPRPETKEGLRAATIHECRKRLLRATGSSPVAVAWLAMPKDALVYFERRAARRKAAKAVLRQVEREPELALAVDVAKLQAWAADSPITDLRASGMSRFQYEDPVTGEARIFGDTPTEGAVMSVLQGNWPARARVGMTPAEAIEEEAHNYVAKSRKRTQKRRE